MRYLKIILAAILFVGCEEYFNPGTDEQEPIYVFSGQLTDQPGPYRVKITKTSGYNSKNETITDAKVYIECNDGRSYGLKCDTSGTYLTDSAQFVGEVGKAYKLVAILADGQQFESSREELLPCPDVDKIDGTYYESKKITTVAGRYVDEVEYGICATNTTTAAGFTPYYRYECKIVMQVRQHYPGAIPIERYVYRPLTLTNSLFIADANDYIDNKIIDNKLYKTSTNALHVGIVLDDPGPGEFEVRNCGEFIRVKQYSIDEKQYKYWKAVKDQQESTNYLFGQVENQPIGNMRGKNGETAFGYFCVSAVKQSICALSLNETKKIVRRYEINYFPDIDTVAYYKEMQDFTIMFEN